MQTSASAGTAVTITGTISSNQVLPDLTKNGFLDALQAAGGSDVYGAVPSTGVRFSSCSGLPCYEDTSGSFWTFPRLNGANVFTVPGAASTPGALFNGAPYTAGTGTTNWPLVLIQPSGTTSTIWNTLGTLFGINGASGFTGNLMDIQINGVDAFKLSSSGTGTFAGTVSGNALAASGNVTGAAYLTGTNCSSAASPAVCVAAPAGTVNVATGATTVVVNDTKVTANSEIFLQFDSSLGTKLGVTCNTTFVNSWVSARTAGTSFTISVASAPATNPACFSYHVVN